MKKEQDGDGLSATLFNIALGVKRASGIKETLEQTASQLVTFAHDVALIWKNQRVLLQAM